MANLSMRFPCVAQRATARLTGRKGKQRAIPKVATSALWVARTFPAGRAPRCDPTIHPDPRLHHAVFGPIFLVVTLENERAWSDAEDGAVSVEKFRERAAGLKVLRGKEGARCVFAAGDSICVSPLLSQKRTMHSKKGRHSINSSACTFSVSGILSPRVLADLRLTNSSTFVPCWTGRL